MSVLLLENPFQEQHRSREAEQLGEPHQGVVERLVEKRELGFRRELL